MRHVGLYPITVNQQIINSATLCSPEVLGPHCSACMQTAPGWARSNALKSAWLKASESTFQRKLFADLKTCKRYACSVHGMSMRNNPKTCSGAWETYTWCNTKPDKQNQLGTCCHHMHTVQCNTVWLHTVQSNTSWLHSVQCNTFWLSEALAHDTSHNNDEINHTEWMYRQWQTAKGTHATRISNKRSAVSQSAWLAVLWCNHNKYTQQSLQLKSPHLSPKISPASWM